MPLVLVGFPNPADWAVDGVEGFVGGAAAQGFQAVVAGLTAWMLDAVVWVVGGVFGFFLEATDPNVQADWFVGTGGPYATTATIGATLLAGFLLVGITQGVIVGDVGGMLRRVGLELPMAVLGMVGLVALTQALIRLTDELSRGLLSRFGDDVGRFTATVGSLSALTGGTASTFVVFLLALVSVLAGVVLVAELVIRGALIYIVVALAPLVFAAQLWPALRGAGRKLLELLVALIVSKLVVAVALAVAAAGAVGAGSPGQVSVLPAPEVGQNPGGSVTQAVGVLLAATAAFGVAAFSPLLVARLLPLTEAALVASGVRGAPLRAGQQALSASYYAHLPGRSRLSSLASAQPATGAGATGTGAAAGGGAAGGAGAAAATAAKAGARAAGAGARAATSTVEAVTSPSPGERPGPGGRPVGQPRRPPGAREGNDGRRG